VREAPAEFAYIFSFEKDSSIAHFDVNRKKLLYLTFSYKQIAYNYLMPLAFTSSTVQSCEVNPIHQRDEILNFYIR
jgi:hypothetical protein